MNNELKRLEALIMHHFKTEPFHNLPMIFGEHLRGHVPGGTCSDKTLSFIKDATAEGFDASLHSAKIGGREIHRLARLCIDDHVYFVDIGNGWPSIKPYPAHVEVFYRCFNMRFRTEIRDQTIDVFHQRNGRDIVQMQIDINPRLAQDIMKDVTNRFDSGIVYPFTNSVRFSKIVGDRFLFLRGEHLEIYRENCFDRISALQRTDVFDVLKKYFNINATTFC